jgi:hypothetical protein
VTAALVSATSALAAEIAASPRPNVIYIMADDK